MCDCDFRGLLVGGVSLLVLALLSDIVVCFLKSSF